MMEENKRMDQNEEMMQQDLTDAFTSETEVGNINENTSNMNETISDAIITEDKTEDENIVECSKDDVLEQEVRNKKTVSEEVFEAESQEDIQENIDFKEDFKEDIQENVNDEELLASEEVIPHEQIRWYLQFKVEQLQSEYKLQPINGFRQGKIPLLVLNMKYPSLVQSLIDELFQMNLNFKNNLLKEKNKVAKILKNEMKAEGYKIYYEISDLV